MIFQDFDQTTKKLLLLFLSCLLAWWLLGSPATCSASGMYQITEAELKRYAGMTADTTVDATSGASLTSASLRAMALTALNAAAGN